MATMTKETFKYLCETYGDKSLPEGEFWKSVAYISTTTTKVPTFSFQYLLKKNRVKYTDDESYGEPGFIIIDNATAEAGPIKSKDSFFLIFFSQKIPHVISQFTPHQLFYVSWRRIGYHVKRRTYLLRFLQNLRIIPDPHQILKLGDLALGNSI